MTKNKLYKHVRCHDTAFYVITPQAQEDGLKVFGYWINIVNPDNHFIHESDTIFIQDDKLTNWAPYESKKF